jgi:hypothetical protein
VSRILAHFGPSLPSSPAIQELQDFLDPSPTQHKLWQFFTFLSFLHFQFYFQILVCLFIYWEKFLCAIGKYNSCVLCHWELELMLYVIDCIFWYRWKQIKKYNQCHRDRAHVLIFNDIEHMSCISQLHTKNFLLFILVGTCILFPFESVELQAFFSKYTNWRRFRSSCWSPTGDNKMEDTMAATYGAQSRLWRPDFFTF